MKLTLIRGLPGSGKTTIAKAMNCFHVEADMYFVSDGVYNYKPELIKKAHAWCLETAEKALKSGLDVVVSNTFTQHWEMRPYLDMAPLGVEIITAKGEWKSVHNVPESIIEKMRARWEQ
jgi:predicted kinase